MTLTGEAKRAYQREWVRQKRGKGSTGSTNVPPKSEVISQLRSIIAGVGKVEPKPIVPLYNASIHHAGDRVRVFDGNRLVEMVIPELDAEGQSMPQSPTSASLESSFNLFKPSFNPNPKPAKKEKKKRSFK